MALLDDVKQALRVSSAALNQEIEDLIASAKEDLQISNVDAETLTDEDPLIKRAIITYCKANFGYNNPDADRFMAAYESLKSHLSLSADHVVE